MTSQAADVITQGSSSSGEYLPVSRNDVDYITWVVCERWGSNLQGMLVTVNPSERYVMKLKIQFVSVLKLTS